MTVAGRGLRLREGQGLVVLVLCAVAIAACGESKGSDRGSGSDAGDAAQVADVMRDLRELFNDGDGDGICAKLTPDGQEEVVVWGRSVDKDVAQRLFGDQRDCAGVVDGYARATVEKGSKLRIVEIRRVSIDGDKAQVITKGGLAGIRSVVPFRLKRVAGEWKLDDPLSARYRTIRTEADGPPVK